MTGFNLPSNFDPNPERIGRVVRRRYVPPQISLSSSNTLESSSDSESESESDSSYSSAPESPVTMAAPKKTLREFSVPSSSNFPGLSNTQEGAFELRSGLVNMVQASPFCGKAIEDANAHLWNFLEVCSTINPNGTPNPPTTFGDVYGKDVRGDVWKLLKKRVSKGISRNVVSLASFNGNTRFFACTGFFIDWDDKCCDNNVSTILTSASLVRNSDPFDGENKVIEGLKIKVKHSKGPLLEGSLIHYNLDYNVALVSVKNSSACPLAICKRNLIYESSKVVAVGRCFETGELMASSGKLVAWSGSFDCKLLLYSTCKITKAGIGGPLVDIDGNFIGMNFYDPKLGTPAVSCDDIVDILECFKKKWTGGGNDSLSNPNSVGGGVQGDCSVCLNWWPVPRPYWRQPDEPEKSYLDEYERRVLANGCKYTYIGGYIHILK